MMPKTFKVLNPKQVKRLLKDAKPKRWSYSAYATHKKCPRSLGLSYVINTVQAPNEAMKKGIKLHRDAEFYLKGEIDKIPKILQPMKHELNGLRKMKPVVEKFWNATEKFKQAADYKGWCVLKMDAHLPPTKKYPVAWMEDHKSGREYDEHAEQAELSAVFLFGRYPKAEAAEFEFWYYDSGETVTFTFPREVKEDITDKWMERGGEVMAERKFLPTPSLNACRFCAHRSHDFKTGQPTGGTCEEWKRAK